MWNNNIQLNRDTHSDKSQFNGNVMGMLTLCVCVCLFPGESKTLWKEPYEYLMGAIGRRVAFRLKDSAHRFQAEHEDVLKKRRR